MRKYTQAEVWAVFKKKGYKTFSGKYDINLFGIRSNESKSDKFDDYVGYWCSDGVNTLFEIFPATTDPGKNWLLTPMRKDGTAIMVPGQYSGLYKIGRHKDYEALEQVGMARYVRDNNKDTVLDFDLYRDPAKLEKFGVWDNIKSNLHRASQFSITALVGLYSAACQVIQDPSNFKKLLAICKKQIEQGLPNKFTYTLLEEKDFE